MDTLKRSSRVIFHFVFQTYYGVGILGWMLIYLNYPFTVVIPRYAGGQ